MKKYPLSFNPLYIAASLFVLCLSGGHMAWSQNLDPTVEISRAYVAKKLDADKALLKMEVPDSVLKFDLDFDYSINANPYKGSYEFRPYALDMRPESRAAGTSSFFLRAGAGYSLHPVVDLVFSPKIRKDTFSMSVYGTNRSYVGRYRALSIDGASGRSAWNKKDFYDGYDTYTSAGVDGRADWKTGCFSFDVGYLGYADRDTVRSRGYNALRTLLRVASRNSARKYFFYDVSVFYQYGKDNLNGGGAKSCLTGHDFSLKASLGPVLSESQRALIDICADVAGYGDALSYFSGKFSITPKYQFSQNRWNLDLGVEFSAFLGNDNVPGDVKVTVGKGQFVYPDIEIGFSAIRNYLNIYVKADGGEKVNRYSEIMGLNRHFSVLYGNSPLMDNTIGRIEAVLGFRGNIASKLLYDLRGGYAFYENLVCNAISYTGGLAAPMIGYADCNCYFAAMDLKWHSQDVSADLSLAYRGTDLLEKHRTVIEPSPFTADASVVYNWNRRIFAGIHCNAALDRKGYAVVQEGDGPLMMTLPGFADLGISAEYRFNRKVSFWLYGGNLLNMTIQRVPLYAESGISLTAGITLNL